MSSGSKRKRATRPWQDPGALRNFGDLLAPGGDDELAVEGYEVKTVSAAQAGKTYVCPECGNSVTPGESHVVVWPEGDQDLRRHWHKHCWRIEARRTNGS